MFLKQQKTASKKFHGITVNYSVIVMKIGKYLKVSLRLINLTFKIKNLRPNNKMKELTVNSEN